MTTDKYFCKICLKSYQRVVELMKVIILIFEMYLNEGDHDKKDLGTNASYFKNIRNTCTVT